MLPGYRLTGLLPSPFLWDYADAMADFNDMLAGYRRFREHGWTEQRERWDELRDGQSPGVLIIACSDSRVDPALIFDTNPGEIFRSEEHTSELQSLMHISYAVFCMKKNNK